MSARWLASFVRKQVLERRASAHHGRLEVALVRGRRVLDAASVNYSFGELHRVLAGAFDRSGVRERAPRDVLLLGLGGGSAIELLRSRFAPAAAITAVDVDPVVVELARRHFHLARWPALDVVVADAARFVASPPRRYDLVVVDVFVDDAIPPAVRCEGFLRDAARALAPGGLLLFNQLANLPERAGAALRFAVLARETLGEVEAFPIRGNLVLAWAAPGTAPPRPAAAAL